MEVLKDKRLEFSVFKLFERLVSGKRIRTNKQSQIEATGNLSGQQSLSTGLSQMQSKDVENVCTIKFILFPVLKKY